MNSKIIYIGTPTNPAISSTILLAELIVKDQVVFISGLNKPDDNVYEINNHYDLIVHKDLLIQETPQHKQKGWYRKFEKKRKDGSQTRMK